MNHLIHGTYQATVHQSAKYNLCQWGVKLYQLQKWLRQLWTLVSRLDRVVSELCQVRWKLLKDVPALQIAKGTTPWEAGMTFHSWRAQMRTICRGVSQDFGTFADGCWERAQVLYDEQLASRVKAKAPSVKSCDIEWDGRLTNMLLRTIPEELKQPVIEEAGGYSITAVALCLAVLTRLQPGGSEEITSLQKFLRYPTIANNFQEMAKEHGATKWVVANVLEMLERECMDLAADEQMKGSSAVDSMVATATADPTKRRKCWFFNTAEGCKKGKDCEYAHEKGGKGKDEPKGSGKGKDKGKEKGGKGKVNQAESTLSPAPKSNPNPKGAPKAEAKADTKAEAKSKAAANKLLGVDENKPSANMTRTNHHCDAWRPTVAKVCRPLDPGMNFGDRNKYLPLDVTLASGKVTTGFRSAKDGEIFMPMEGHDWIAGLSKLVGAGFKFVWDRSGPKLISEDTGIVTDAVLRNGLPYVKWSDFKRARSNVSRIYKKAPDFMCDLSFNAHVQEEPPTILKAGEHMAFEIEGSVESTVAAPAELDRKQLQEERAKQMAAKSDITARDILGILEGTDLRRRNRRRSSEGSGDEKVSVWTFGKYQHGPHGGITDLTCQRPELTRLLTQFVRQQHPEHRFTTITVTEDVAFRPHRDKFNAKGSVNLAIGLTKHAGFEIWVHDASLKDDPKAVWRVAFPGKPSAPGSLLRTSGTSCTFNPHDLHGTEPFTGHPVMLLAYTPRIPDEATPDVISCLQSLGFTHWGTEVKQRCGEDEAMNPQASAVEASIGSESNITESTDIHSQAPRVRLRDESLRSVEVKPIIVEPRLDKVPLPEVKRDSKEVIELDDDDGVEPWDEDELNEFLGIIGSGLDDKVPMEAPAAPSASADSKPASSSGELGPFASEAELSLLKQMLKKCQKGHFGDFAQMKWPKGESLPYVELLANRKHTGILKATMRIMARITSMAGGKPSVFRIHSDNALEFWADKFIDSLERAKVLGIKVPDGTPRPGDWVLVKRQQPEAFGDRTVSAVYLGHDDSTVRGAWVLQRQQQQDNTIITRARLPMLDNKKRTRWKRTFTPGGESIWTSTIGDVAFAGMPPEDRDGDVNILTLEERLDGPVDSEANLQRALLMRSLYVGSQSDMSEDDQVGEFVRFAHGFLSAIPDEEDGVPAASAPPVDAETVDAGVAAAEGDAVCTKVAAAPTIEAAQSTPEYGGNTVNWQKYHLLSYEEEQLANQVEASLLEASVAPVQAETVDLKGFFQGDRQQQWRESLIAEYAKMDGVLREVPRAGLRKHLNISPEAKLPREIPSKVVPTMKPSDDPRANADGFMEKSRICACGNFEEGTDNNGEPWSSSNIPPEIVRCFVSLAAKVEDWTLGGLDVEAAFLNAEISGDPVIITPPKIMRDLGIIAENTVRVAERNIYRLRRGPTEWERERDHKLNHAELPPGDGDKLGALHLVPLNLAAGLWKIVDGAGVTRGACCAHVDDGLIVGGIDMIRRVTAFIQSLWAIKGHCILEKPGVGLSKDLVVSESLTLKLVQCMRFLGAEISVASDGLRIGQAKYVAQELRARGWLALKGAESLPVPSEGLQGSDIRDNAFENNMKLAQKEAGTLTWIALRSRPDIAACLGVASTLITSRPSESLRLCKGIWRYLRSTWNKTLHYRYGGGPVSPGGSDADAEWTFRIVSDASLAPGGARSRSGIALFLGDHLVYWRSQRQSIVAWSATESEIEATAAAIQEGIKIHAVLEELLACKIHIIANGDNAGAIHLITRERFHEQTMRKTFRDSLCIHQGFGVAAQH
ncbi:RE1 [Symbiodinium sp. CCMP2592]|nr:RE1 [Symbiodinium sp. CCMP2592]